MCILVAEIIMLIGGLYALITGKIKLTRNMRLEGWQARVAGLILVAPLLLALLIGVLLGFLVGADVLSESVLDYAGIIELALVLLALVAVVIFGLAVRKPAPGAESEPPTNPS